MASDIKFHCGCHFSTAELEEAEKHSNETGHILTVQGTIKPRKE